MSSSVVVGVIGAGNITKKAVAALLADRFSTEPPRFILPVTEEHWTMAVRSAAQWAMQHEHPFEVILDGSESDVEGVEDVLEAASTSHKVTAVETKMVSLLADADDGILLLAWDDKDDACQRALTRAIKREVAAFDLLDGLNKLRFDDEPEPEPPAVAEEPEEKPKRKRRTKAEMEADRLAAEVTKQPQDDVEAGSLEPTVVSSGPIELIATEDEGQTVITGLSLVDVIEARSPMDAAVSLFAMALQDMLTEAAKQGAMKVIAELDGVAPTH